MHHCWHARQNFHGRHPGVFLERRGERNALPLDDAFRRHGIRWQVECHVGRDLPAALGPGDRRRRVPRIPFGRACIDPCGNQIDVQLLERPVVIEVAVARIGKPRRHRTSHHRLLDRPRPRARLLVGEHRERPDLAGAMAALAVLLENRNDVLMESHRRRRALVGRGHSRCTERHSQDRDDRKGHDRNPVAHGDLLRRFYTRAGYFF